MIIQKFQEIEDGIQSVRKEITEMMIEIRYNDMLTRLFPYVQTLDTALHYANWNDSASLKAICGEQVVRCFEALRVMVKHIPELVDIYYEVQSGYRSHMMNFAAKWSLMIGKSMIMVQGLYPNDTKQDIGKELQVDLDEMKKSLTNTIDRCTNESIANMEMDMEIILKSGQQNDIKRVLENLYTNLTAKYDWLDLAVFVYNDISGFDNHCFIGNPNEEIHSLHKYGKNSVVFIRDKNYHPTSERKSEIEVIKTQLIDKWGNCSAACVFTPNARNCLDCWWDIAQKSGGFYDMVVIKKDADLLAVWGKAFDDHLRQVGNAFTIIPHSSDAKNKPPTHSVRGMKYAVYNTMGVRVVKAKRIRSPKWDF